MSAHLDSIILAPDLPSEQWWSMDYYWREFQVGMGADLREFHFEVALPPRNTPRLWRRHVAYPSQIRDLSRIKQGRSLLHVLDHSYGHLCREDLPSIISCHDLAEWRERTLSWPQHLWWKSRVLGVRRARHCFALSESTANDLEEFLGIPRSQITVNPMGVDGRFKPLMVSEEDVNRYPRLDSIRRKKKEDCLLLLHVGSNIPRKNIATLLRALKGLQDRGVRVCLIKAGESLKNSRYVSWIRENRLQESIIEVERPDFDELHRIYSLSDIFCFPSSYEGQGLPVLEAQACGIPCIISSSTSLREVGGDAALYHESHCDDSLLSQIMEIYSSSQLRENLIQKGFRNTQRFTWREHFERIGEVYRRVWRENS
jgi:glycosyltransferase involved in cell wall biosynthesis